VTRKTGLAASIINIHLLVIKLLNVKTSKTLKLYRLSGGKEVMISTGPQGRQKTPQDAAL
jgi:hypothetical protein